MNGTKDDFVMILPSSVNGSSIHFIIEMIKGLFFPRSYQSLVASIGPCNVYNLLIVC